MCDNLFGIVFPRPQQFLSYLSFAPNFYDSSKLTPSGLFISESQMETETIALNDGPNVSPLPADLGISNDIAQKFLKKFPAIGLTPMFPVASSVGQRTKEISNQLNSLVGDIENKLGSDL